MKKMFAILGCVLALLSAMAPAWAGENGSQEEAVAMARKAVAFIKAKGKEQAFAEFTNPAGQFKDRDLYVIVIDNTGKTLAHGGNPRLVGKMMIDLADADGKAFIKSFIDVANAKGKGWVDYKWVNPVTKALQNKSSYVEKADDVIVACGIYKE